MLEAMGIRTGIDLDRLVAVARNVETVVGHSDSAMLKAGPTHPEGDPRLVAKRQA
jgi:hypothetical protein